jgi:type VI secretion system protein ImpM
MNHVRFSLPESSDLPGWYGKLPGMGDFAHRRLPNRFVSAWDKWLQHGFEHLRGLHADWQKSYIEGHVWFFMLGPSVIGSKPWVGLLVPSVDAVGRYFPLTIAVELSEASDAVAPDLELAQRMNSYAQATLDAIDLDMGAENFDKHLLEVFACAPSGYGYVDVPKAGRSTWHVNADFQGNQGFSMGGMPGNAEFNLLFASADEATEALKVLAQ